MLLDSSIKSTYPLNQKQRRFIHLYIVVLLVCFSPSKALGALVPFIFLAGMLFYVQHLPIRHLIRYTVFLMLYSWMGGVYFLLYDDFSFGNFYFFLITGASLLILLYDFRGLITEHLIYKIVQFTSIIIVFEACFGLTQVVTGFSTTGTFDSNTGDFVKGTIEPSFFSNIGTGSNQMFAILMSIFLLLVFIFSQNWSKKRTLLIGIVVLSFVMASVMHAIIFLIVAIFLAIIFKVIFGINLKKLFVISRRWRVLMILFTVVFIIGILVSIFLPRNLATIDIYLKQTLNFSAESHSPKTVATYLSIYNLPQDEPLQSFIGLGLGQYSSRAALIRSGEYLSIGALLPTYVTPYLEAYILPLWRKFMEIYASGSTYFPFYSWLSLYGETGWLGVLFVIGLLFVVARKILKHESVIFPYMQIGLLILMFYIALLGFQDNYWEWTQAVFPAFLIFRLGTQYLFNERKILYEQYAHRS